jgi:hypothetical protein
MRYRPINDNVSGASIVTEDVPQDLPQGGPEDVYKSPLEASDPQALQNSKVHI